jgi:hypothetical protein
MNASERELSWRMAKWYVVATVRPLYETIAATVNELGKTVDRGFLLQLGWENTLRMIDDITKARTAPARAG